MAGILGIPPKYCHDFISSVVAKKPHGTTPKGTAAQKTERKCGSSVITRPKQPCRKLTARKLISVGHLAADGQYYPTQESAARVNRAIAEREYLLRKLEMREKLRLERLKRAAKAGDIAFTKEGVVETQPCQSCNVYHKVPSLCSVNEPCSCSKVASYPLRSHSGRRTKKASEKETAATQTSRRQLLEMCTQTSKKRLQEMTTQTSRKQLPEMATQTSKRLLPIPLGPTASCLKPTPPSSKPPAQRRKLRFKIVTHCLVEDPSNSTVRGQSSRQNHCGLITDKYCVKDADVDENVMLMDEVSECSTCESTSVMSTSEFSECSSCLERAAERENEVSADEKMVIMEKNALADRLEREKKRYHEAARKLKRTEIETAQREERLKQELDNAKLTYADKLRRKLALKAMLSLLNEKHEHTQMVVENDKAQQRVEEEKRKLKELLAEQMRLHLKKKVSSEGEAQGYQLPGQADGVKSCSSQLSRVSSFSISKIIRESKIQYTREEACTSPKLMKNILDSLPDVPVSLTNSCSGFMTEEVSTESLNSKKHLRMDIRHTLTVLERVSKTLMKVVDASLAIYNDKRSTLPSVAAKSKVEKLPPLFRMQSPVNMTTVPLRSSQEKPYSLVDKCAQEVPRQVYKVNAEPEIAKKECTCGAVELAPEKKVEGVAKHDEDIVAMPVPATSSEEKDKEREVVVDVIEAAKRAKIAEVERAMKKKQDYWQAEFEKVKKTWAEEGAAATAKRKAEALKAQASVDVVEAAKKAKIAEVEESMKKKDEYWQAEFEKVKKTWAEEGAAATAKRNAEALKAQASVDVVEAAKKAKIAEVEESMKKKDEYWKAEFEKVKVSWATEVAKDEVDTKQVKVSWATEVAKESKIELDTKLAEETKTKEDEEEQIIDAARGLASAVMESAQVKSEEASLAQMPLTDKDTTVRGDEEKQQQVEETNEGGEKQQDGGNKDDESEESAVEPNASHHCRPPTPPAHHASRFHSNTSLFGSQMSLRTINEGGACDFTPEFASPLTTHSMHAVLPYQSFRTRLGLRAHQSMSDRQLNEEMVKISQATLLIQKEMIKRQQMKELSNEGIADPEAEDYPDEEDSGTSLEGEASESLIEGSDVVSELKEEESEQTMGVSVDGKSLIEDMATSEMVESQTKEGGIDTVPPEAQEPTIKEEMTIEADKAKEDAPVDEQNVENVEENGDVVMCPESRKASDSSLKRASLWSMESRRSVRSTSVDSLEEEYARVLQSTFDMEASVTSLKSEASKMEEAENTVELKSPSNSSVKSAASKTSVRSKTGSKASLNGETERTVSMQKSPSMSSVKSVASKTSVKSKSGSKASLKDETSSAADHEPLEVEDGQTVDSEIKNTLSASSIKSQASAKSTRGSQASLNDATPVVEAQPEQQAVEDVQKSLSKSSVKSAASKTSVRSKSGSKASLNGEAGTVSVKDSPSKSSVASKTSVKSKSGSKASLNKEDVAKEPESLSAGTAQPDNNQMQKAPSTSSVKSKASQASVTSKSGSKVSLKRASPEPEQTQVDENQQTDAVQDSHSKSSIEPVASRGSVKSKSGSKMSVTKDDIPEEPNQMEAAIDQAEKDEVSKALSKSSLKSKAGQTSVKSKTGSNVSLKQSYAEVVVTQAAVNDQQTNIDVSKSRSKSSIKSTASKTSVKSKSGSKASLNGETGTVSVKDSPSKSSVASKTSVRSKSGSKTSLNGETGTVSVKESPSKSSVTSKTSGRSKSGSKASLNKESNIPQVVISDADTLEAESSQGNKGEETLKAPSTTSVKSKPSQASMKSDTESKDSPQTAQEGESQENEKMAVDIQKTPSKSSVRSTASKTSVRSKSGSKASLNGETGTVSVKDSPSKSSVASKTSVRSKSGSKTSLNKEENTPQEIVSNAEPLETQTESTDVAKGSSASSLKTKASGTSVSSKAGSNVAAVDNLPSETKTEPIQTEDNNQAVSELPKDRGKTSVKSSTSVKSQSGSSKLGAEIAIESQQTANVDMQKTPSKLSVKSEASKTSVRSKSGSKASLNGETEGDVKVENNLSKLSVKSTASKTSVKSKSGSKASLKDASNPPRSPSPQVLAKSPTGSATSLKSLRTSMKATILPSMGSKASLGTARTGSKASMKEQASPAAQDAKAKSPTGSTTSLKSLRNSMKSMILPSMGSKASLGSAKSETVENSSATVENKVSYAAVVKSGSTSDSAETQES